jgi:hypothetical protein
MLDPQAWYRALWGNTPAMYPPQPRPATDAPIAVQARAARDGSFVLTTNENSVTIEGVAKGPVWHEDRGYSTGGSSFSVSLDVHLAPTVDVFGKSNSTARNRRFFVADTPAGASAAEVARSLANEIVRAGEFGAMVSVAANGTATIHFSRR